MKTHVGVIGLVLLMAILAWRPASGANVTWVGGSGGGAFGTAGNWSGAAVPGPGDSVFFTNLANNATLSFAVGNVTNANVTLTLDSGLRDVIFNMSSWWWVTNTFNCGAMSGSTTGSIFRLTGAGTLVVTNSSRTATFNLWARPSNTDGPHILRDGGALVADHFYTVTNSPGGILYQLYAGAGSLTTWGDSEILTSQSLRLAGLGDFTWNVFGGTNWVRGGGDFVIGSTATLKGMVVVSNAVLKAAKGPYFGGNGSSVVVTNGGRLDSTGGNLALGANGLAGINGVLKVSGSNSAVTVVGQTYIDQAASTSNGTVTVENGATFTGPGASQCYVGYNGRNARLIVSGAGSAFSGYSQVDVGGSGSGVNTGSGSVLVTNGASMSGVNTINVGYGSSGAGDLAIVGPGSFFGCTYLLNVGSNSVAALLGRGTVTIADGAMFEGNGINVGAAGMGVVSNIGGTFQFYVSPASLTLTTKTPNALVLTNGTISFRSVTDANVNGNVSGTPMTNITFQGNNAFRLNNASNTTSGQAYVFDTGRGATNYTRLELLNGATYRGGAVTIGAGGTLVVSNGLSTVASNLTFQPGGVFAVHLTTNAATSGLLAAGGAVAFNGATLQVTLGALPTESQFYTILSNPGTAPVAGLGTFSTPSVDAVYGGKTYTLAIRYGVGDGNDVAVSLATKGTIVITR